MFWIPMIMAAAALTKGVVDGVSSAKQAKAQAKAVQAQTQENIDARARASKKLMSQQQSSFLKSGVYFEGSPLDVFNETYKTSVDDINAMRSNAHSQIKSLQNQAGSSFTSNIIQGIGNAALSYFGAGGTLGAAGSGLTKGASMTGTIAKSAAGSNSWLTARNSMNIFGSSL